MTPRLEGPLAVRGGEGGEGDREFVRGFWSTLVTRSLPEPILDHGSHGGKETDLQHRKRLTLLGFSSDVAEKNLTYKILIWNFLSSMYVHMGIPWEAATVSGSIQMDGYRDRDLGEILHYVM